MAPLGGGEPVLIYIAPSRESSVGKWYYIARKPNGPWLPREGSHMHYWLMTLPNELRKRDQAYLKGFEDMLSKILKFSVSKIAGNAFHFNSRKKINTSFVFFLKLIGVYLSVILPS